MLGSGYQERVLTSFQQRIVTFPSAILNFTFPFPGFEIRHRVYFANEVVAARTEPKASGTVGSCVRL